MENYITKAADAFLTSRPYGIRLDFKRKGFVIFNHHMNLLGNATPCNVDLYHWKSALWKIYRKQVKKL